MLQEGDPGKEAREKLCYTLLLYIERALRRHLKNEILLSDWGAEVLDLLKRELKEHEQKMAASWFAGVSRN